MNLLVKQRKSIIAVGLIAIVLIIGALVNFYLNAPTNMIALDINPSIELHTNRLGHVVSIDPVNEDAVQLMSGYQLEDRNLESVIKDIVDRMIFNGYLKVGETNQILVTANNTNTSDELLGKVKTTIADYLQVKQLPIKLLQQKLDVNNEDTEIAHDNKVSVGKMAVIDKFLENGSIMPMKELASASIKELMQYSIEQNIPLGELIDNYSIVLGDQRALEDKEAAQDMEKADTVKVDATSSATVAVASDDTVKVDSTSGTDVAVASGSKVKVKVDAISSATVTAGSGGKAGSEEDASDVEDAGEDNASKDSSKYEEKDDSDEDNDANKEDSFEEDNDDKDEDYNNNADYDSEDEDDNKNSDYESEDDSDNEDNHYSDTDRQDNNEDYNNQGEDD